MTEPSISEALKSVAGDIPAEVTEWLGRLALLYGAPFHYLVPEAQMLPRESIRFFFLDPIWIRHLIQGACSVGNNGYGDTLVDRAMSRWVTPNADGEDTSGPAGKAAGVRARLQQQLEGRTPEPHDDTLHWPLTGFLLRSAVVEGWRGLEVTAYQTAGAKEKAAAATAEDNDVVPLQPLRIEQLSQDVMLGLFNGRMAQLVIRQPQEGLHFGLTPKESAFTKTLRDPHTGEELQGRQIDLSDGDLMRNADLRVVNMRALADRMSQGLADAVQPAPERFTSAEFAVQMIEAPGEFTYILEY